MKHILTLLLAVIITVTFVACADESANESSAADAQSASVDSHDESSETSSEKSEENSSEESVDSSAEESEEPSHDESKETSHEESKETSREESAATSHEESKENSREESKETSREESKVTSHEESKVTSHEESKEPSEVSEEPSEVSAPAEKTAQPKIYGCTRIENGIFVILGTCEQGSEITVRGNNKTFKSKSDHGYFSVRVDLVATSVKLEVTAQTEGKDPSAALEYTARPKSVDSSQWRLIAGSNYQFHLEYTLNDYLRNNTYNQRMLDSLTDKLKRRADNLKEISPDSEIIYMLIPSPATTYPETMPDSYVPKSGPSRLEQVTDAIGKAGIKVIDLRKAFAAHKNDEYKLYWKTDSHWTDYGAYIAYKELFDYISKKHPECKPRDFDEFNWVEDDYLGGDMAMYLEYFGSNGYNESNTPMKEHNVLRVPKFDMPRSISSIERYVGGKRLTYNTMTVQHPNNISTNRSELPSALIMRDSYSTQLFDIVAERFNNTWYKGMWDYSFMNREIQQKQPDYIIYILVERNLDSVFS